MLHNSKNHNHDIEPRDGRREPLCSNEVIARRPSVDLRTPPFDEDTFQALKALGEVLSPIYERMIVAGYEFRDGKAYKKVAS